MCLCGCVASAVSCLSAPVPSPADKTGPMFVHQAKVKGLNIDSSGKVFLHTAAIGVMERKTPQDHIFGMLPVGAHSPHSHTTPITVTRVQGARQPELLAFSLLPNLLDVAAMRQGHQRDVLTQCIGHLVKAVEGEHRQELLSGNCRFVSTLTDAGPQVRLRLPPPTHTRHDTA